MMLGSFLQREAVYKLKDLKHNKKFVWGKDKALDKYYLALKEDIEKNGLNKNIDIDSNNIITDGHHRARILLDLHNPDYVVTVNKWLTPSWVILLGITILDFSKWVISKAKALYTMRG